MAFGSPESRGRQFDYGSIGDTLPTDRAVLQHRFCKTKYRAAENAAFYAN
ncbi:hypothetical protein ABS771_02835 [Methylobacterium brachiatum]|nr:hypothetical protein [Methylobacterium sp. GXF4]